MLEAELGEELKSGKLLMMFYLLQGKFRRRASGPPFPTSPCRPKVCENVNI